jgi:uncharacterized protein YdeI (YjbR/CyaY-like superfamily)
MGHFGRITAVSDLPPERVLAGYVKSAMRLNENGVAHPTRQKRAASPAPAIPEALAAALAKHPKARAAFDAFSPSHRREYAEWIAEAKQAATRDRRVATAIEWLAEGKPRNWKYAKR